jgi:hypothetical protein
MFSGAVVGISISCFAMSYTSPNAGPLRPDAMPRKTVLSRIQ